MQIEGLERKMEKLREEEEARIGRQFLHFDYARKYGATEAMVRLSLFGEEGGSR